MISKENNWYAVYVTRHHERKAFMWIRSMGIEALFPIRTVERRWSDRIKRIQEPLFPSYLFVKTSCKKYFEVLEHPSIIKYISFGGDPATIPETQIEFLKDIDEHNIDCEVARSNSKPGEKVVISEGPLSGREGEITYCCSRQRFVLKMDSIGHSLLVNIPAKSLLKKLPY